MATKSKSSKGKTKKIPAKKSTKATAVVKAPKLNQSSKISSLNKWNVALAVVFAAQALAILILGKAITLPIVTHYLATDTLASQAAGHNVQVLAVRHLFDIDVRYLVAAFLGISALMYLLIATIRRKSYEADLQKHINPLRWLDFGLSSGIMFLVIALLNGVYDISSLVMIFTLVALLHFMAYFGEVKVTNLRAKMQTLVAICVAGAAVWITIAAYLKGALFYGSGLSHYVYWIDGSIFVITLCLAANKFQVFRAKGKWADYLFGERVFMLLSFVAKTGLAWLVFAGLLK